jgi:GTP pyrophosphokinase
VRIVMIKLADRLHNIRTLGHMPEAKRKRIAQETLDIFAPLANRLGIWQIKWELEDLAFRYVNPEKYREIADAVASQRSARERETEAIKIRMEKLARAGICAMFRHAQTYLLNLSQNESQGCAFYMIHDLRGWVIASDDDDIVED